MDVLSDVLDLLSAKSYTTSGIRAPEPWGITYGGFEGLKFLALQQGSAWLKTELQPQWRQLKAGEGCILTRHQTFSLATSPQQPCPMFTEFTPEFRDGMANYGGDELVVIAGKMEIDKMSSSLLTGMLPPVMYFSTQAEETANLNFLMKYLQSEKLYPQPGSESITDHLMHILMVETLRKWSHQPGNASQGWMNAGRDHRIMRVLSALHANPQKHWQLTELAELAGMSRAGFVRRFSDVTGTTPLKYLTQWRMRLASKALRTSNQSIKQIGFDLGYASESAFSSAFSRVFGHSASEHRQNKP